MLFIEHVRRVAARVAGDPDPRAVPAALLHDVIEKGSAQWADLRAAGADDRLIAVIDALTERENEHEDDYLARCAADPLALRIKRADVRDKLTIDPATTLGTGPLAMLHTQARQRLDLLERLSRQHEPV